MIPIPTHPDVVVIGAGAAGLAAGRELSRLGIAVLILEARDRIGGRAWTLDYGNGPPLDLGCEWLHSADTNILAALATDLGIGIDKSEPPWRRPARQADFSLAEQQAFNAAQSAFEVRVQMAANQARRTGHDRPASDLLDPGSRWNGLIDAISTFYNGAPLERVSVLDYDRYVDTEVNWRVDGGYGALIAATGLGLPIRLGCAARAVDATGRDLRIETTAGRIEARGVIVTVPTNVLAEGTIAFPPDLDDHLHAAASLPLGLADKLFLALDKPDAFEPDTRLIGATDRTAAGAYTLRPRGRPMIEGYFGGDHARALEKGGLRAFVAAAHEDIGRVLGPEVLNHVTPILATGWASDPLALGSYSHALPGCAAARAALARQIDERILFAGRSHIAAFFLDGPWRVRNGPAAGQAMASYVQRRRGVGASPAPF